MNANTSGIENGNGNGNGDALAIGGLSCAIGGHTILQDVSLTLRRGELCCLIGPNGSGKSTLLRCLARLLDDSWTGHIAIHGRDIRSLSRRDLARLVAYVPQLHGNLPDYSVDEFLRLSRYAHGDIRSPQASRAVRDALAQVRLPSALAHRSLRTLSGGECRRAFIAAGLVQETHLLLLDEPEAFLDPSAQEDIHALLDDLHQDDAHTIFCVSHDLNAALLHADRLAALQDGHLAFVAPPRDIRPHGLLDDLFRTPFDYAPHPVAGQPMALPRAPHPKNRGTTC